MSMGMGFGKEDRQRLDVVLPPYSQLDGCDMD